MVKKNLQDLQNLLQYLLQELNQNVKKLKLIKHKVFVNN
jgi:hypothetical protein